MIRFEYISHDLAEKEKRKKNWCRHHVQFHSAYDKVRSDFLPNKYHIPTGWVTIEEVIRFLVTDLGVRPLTKKWDEELRKSEEQFRKWTSREVP